MNNIKLGARVKFYHEGLDSFEEGHLLYIDKNNYYLICLSSNDPGKGWDFRVGMSAAKNLYTTYFDKFKELFPDKNLDKSIFYWTDKIEEIIQPESPKSFKETITPKEKEEKVAEEKAVAGISGNTLNVNQDDNSATSYYSGVLHDGIHLVAAKEVIETLRNLILSIMKDEYLAKNKVPKTKQQTRQFDNHMQTAREIMSGSIGTVFISLVLGELIRSGSEFGGEYVALLKHPEVLKFGRSVHVLGMYEGGSKLLNVLLGKIKEVLGPIMGNIFKGTEQMRIMASKLDDKTRIEDGNEEEAMKEAVAVNEHTAASPAKEAAKMN